MACKLECLGNARNKFQCCKFCELKDECNLLCDTMDYIKNVEDCDDWEDGE